MLGVREGRERVDRVSQRVVREEELLGVFAHRAVGVSREEGDVPARVAKGGDHHHALGLAFASGGVHRATKARLVRVGRELGRGRAVEVRVAKLREIAQEGARAVGGEAAHVVVARGVPARHLPPAIAPRAVATARGRHGGGVTRGTRVVVISKR